MAQVKKEFTQQELDYVQANAATKRDEVIAKELTELVGYPVVTKAVRAMRVKLNIVKSRGRGANRILTAEEVKVMVEKAAARKAEKAAKAAQPVETTPVVETPVVA